MTRILACYAFLILAPAKDLLFRPLALMEEYSTHYSTYSYCCLSLGDYFLVKISLHTAGHSATVLGSNTSESAF